MERDCMGCEKTFESDGGTEHCQDCKPKPKRTWYEEIVETVNQIGDEFGLDGRQKEKLREQIVMIAKDQYKLGNKSGIRWARLNPPRKINGV